MSTHTSRTRRWNTASARVLGASLALGACDLSVTNPGATPDSYLDNQAAWQAVANGVAYRLGRALTDIGIDVAIRTRELHATATNTYFYVYPEAHNGTDNPDSGHGWGTGSGAVWLGDAVIRRFSEVLGGGDKLKTNKFAAQAYLWGAYAHRTMGEYFCDAVFDGGPLQPGTEWFKRAEERFTKAIDAAQGAGLTNEAMAARAGRASVRVDLGDWAGAVADAKQVPTTFSFKMPYYLTGDWRDYNILYYYSAPEAAAQVLTVWNTVYEKYYQDTKDPRTPWATQSRPYGSGSLQPWGAIPWWTQTKYKKSNDPIELSSGQEMRLIEAEALLRDRKTSEAMTLINGLRTAVGEDAWPAPATLAEAWMRLKRERGIELWLEARRLMDFRRWKAGNTPGDLDPAELGLTAPLGKKGPDLRNAPLCRNIPNSERDVNPNLERI